MTATTSASRQADLPHRRTREGDWSREIRRRIQHARPRARRRGLGRHRQRPDQAHSRRGCAFGRRRARRVHARASARACVVGREVQGRSRAARLALPPALRRPNSLQRSAGGAGRGGGVRDRAVCGFAGPRRVRAAGARHRLRRATRTGDHPGAGRGRPAALATVRANPPRHSSRRPCGSKRNIASPAEHHNPMETFAATAVWEGDGRITVFDKTQGAQNCRNYVAGVFGMPRDKVRVLSPYVGGAFGAGLRPQYELPLAVLAALALQRSVRVNADPAADVHARAFALRPSRR